MLRQQLGWMENAKAQKRLMRPPHSDSTRLKTNARSADSVGQRMLELIMSLKNTGELLTDYDEEDAEYKD